MYEQLQQIRMYLSGMWKYRWYGIAASWLVCLGAWGFVYHMPDVYEASGKIQIDMNSLLKPILKGLAVESDQSNTVNLMTRRLMSRPVLERIVRETDLNLKATNDKQLQHLLNHLRDSIEIQNPKGSDRANADTIVEISYKDTSPKLAYSVVKKVIDMLVENTLGANQADTDVAHGFLKEQIKIYEKRLSDAEQRLAEFKKKNVGIMVMPGQQGGYYNRLQTANDDLRKIENDLQLARNKVKILKTQIAQEVARSVTASYDKKIQEHEDKLNTLLLQYTNNHPDVQAEKAIISSLQRNKQKAIQDAANGQNSNQNDNSLQLDTVYQNLQIALKEAEVNVSNIEASRAEQQNLIQTLKKQVDTAPEIEAQLARLNRDYEITKKKYAELVSRLDSARISSQAEKSSEDVNFKVIEPPIVPILPVGPKRLLLNTAALLAGIAAFFGIAYLILQLKPVFLTRRELSAATGLPVLGTVTMILDSETRRHKKKERYIMISLGLAQLVVFLAIAYWQH